VAAVEDEGAFMLMLIFEVVVVVIVASELTSMTIGSSLSEEA
jgi:hypothetical protein